MAITVTSTRSRIVLVLPASAAEAAATAGAGGLSPQRVAEIEAGAAGAAADAIAAASGGLELAAGADGAGAGGKGAAGSPGASAAKRAGTAGGAKGVAGGLRGLFSWVSGVATRVATRCFLVVAGLQAVGGVLRRIHEAAQNDRGWARMVDAGQRLGGGLVAGLLGSQIVVAGIERAAEALERAATAMAGEGDEADGPGLLAWAGSAWGDVARAFEGFAERATDIGTIVVGRLELALGDILGRVQGAAEYRVRARQEGTVVLDAPGGPSVALTLPGSGGVVYDAPQNRIHGSSGTARFEGFSEGFLRIAGTWEQNRAAIEARIAAAEGRLYGEGALAGQLAPGRAGRPDPDAPPSSPAGAARVATRTGVRQLLEKVGTWATGGPGSAIFNGLQRISSAADQKLSDAFATVRETVSALKAQIATMHATLVPVLASTEKLADAFATLAAQVEAIGESDARVARATAKARLGLLAATAIVQASIETAAGIAAAISLRVADAILHFLAAGSFVAAAVLAGGRAAGAFGARTPEDARALAQGEVDGIVEGIAGGAGGRPGSLVLVVHGDADLEDEAWLRANVLDPIVKGTPPPAAGTDGLRGLKLAIRRPATTDVVREAILNHTRLKGKEGTYGAAVAAVIGALIAGPNGYAVGLQIGYYLDREVTRVRRQVQNEWRRARRRLRKIF